MSGRFVRSSKYRKLAQSTRTILFSYSCTFRARLWPTHKEGLTYVRLPRIWTGDL